MEIIDSEREESNSSTPDVKPEKRRVKTALHQAILDCRIQQVRLLVLKHGANINAQDLYGHTPLMLSCLLENQNVGEKVFRLLMKQSPLLNTQDNLGRSVLHYASIKGRDHLVERLLQEDSVDVTLADNEGNTALMLAAICGHVTLVEMLLTSMVRFGLAIDHRNNNGDTALILACQHGQFTCARVIFNKGGAQATLKDYRNGWDAKEWAKNTSTAMIDTPTPGRSSPVMPSRSVATFYRESTLYPDCTTDRTCKHSAPTGRSLGSALRLPAIFKGLSDGHPVYCTDKARQLLLHEMDVSKRRPGHSKRSKSTKSVTSSVLSRKTTRSTSKLIALDKPVQGGPDIKTSINLLFKLFSEQNMLADSDCPVVSSVNSVVSSVPRISIRSSDRLEVPTIKN